MIFYNCTKYGHTITFFVMVLLLSGSSFFAFGQQLNVLDGISLPEARSAAVAVVYNNKILVLGGYDQTGVAQENVWEYDPTTTEWRILDNMRDARADFAAVIYRNELYAIGGRRNNNNITEKTEVYNFDTQLWRNADNLKTERQGHKAIVRNDSLFVVGGTDEGDQYLDAVEFLDDDKWELNTWTLPVSSAQFAAASNLDTIFTAGGYSTFGPLAIASILVSGETSTALASLPSSRGNVTGVYYRDNFVILGGKSATNIALDEIYQINPNDEAWTSRGVLNQAREGAASVVFDSEIFVFGGIDNNGEKLTSAEYLTDLVRPVTVIDNPEVDRGKTIAILPLVNDFDPAGGTLSILGVSTASQGVATVTDLNTITYVANEEFIGNDTLNYVVQNTVGGRSYAQIIIKVLPGNAKPVFDTTPISSAAIGMEYRYDIETSDENHDDTSLTIKALKFPAWLSFETQNNTANLIGTPTLADVGSDTISIQVSDGVDSTQQDFVLYVLNAAPAIPTLIKPTNGDTVTKEKPVFEWQTDTLSTITLQISSTSDFNTILEEIQDITTDSVQVTTQLNNQSYYYARIKAKNVIGESDWSAPTQFYIFIQDVANEDAELPNTFHISAAYPNPFTEQAIVTIEEIDTQRSLSVTIFNLLGQPVTTLHKGYNFQANRQFIWQAIDDNGNQCAAGVYLIVIQNGDAVRTQKITLIR